MDTDVANPKELEQKMRAKLKESFLRAVNELNGQKCKILTYEQSSLEATFSGWKQDGSEVLVREMTTPASVHIESALLRTPDIIAVEFEQPLQLS